MGRSGVDGKQMTYVHMLPSLAVAQRWLEIVTCQWPHAADHTSGSQKYAGPEMQRAGKWRCPLGNAFNGGWQSL
jgi:hypothetical protein